MPWDMEFRGLSDSLKLSDMKELKDLEIPEYAELTADVKDFSLGMTATVATTGLLEDFNLDDVKDSKDLKKSWILLQIPLPPSLREVRIYRKG